MLCRNFELILITIGFFTNFKVAPKFVQGQYAPENVKDFLTISQHL